MTTDETRRKARKIGLIVVIVLGGLAAVAGLLFAGSCVVPWLEGALYPKPTATATLTATPAPTQTPVPTKTLVPTITLSPTPTVTATATSTATPTTTPTPTPQPPCGQPYRLATGEWLGLRQAWPEIRQRFQNFFNLCQISLPIRQPKAGVASGEWEAGYWQPATATVKTVVMCLDREPVWLVSKSIWHRQMRRYVRLVFLPDCGVLAWQPASATAPRIATNTPWPAATSTAVPPTNTAVPQPTNRPPTSTSVPATFTPAPSITPAPATPTIGPSPTGVLPTSTSVPPTSTSAPPTPTPVPPTAVPTTVRTPTPPSVPSPTAVPPTAVPTTVRTPTPPA